MDILGIPMNIVWFLTGIGFIFLEFIIPGLVIAFFGVGAIITGIVTTIFTVSLEVQVLIFSITSVLCIILLRKYFTKVFAGKEFNAKDNQNFNIDVGKIVPVVELIEPGVIGGKVKYQGSLWPAQSDQTISPGDSVEIIGRDNITLIVKKKDD